MPIPVKTIPELFSRAFWVLWRRRVGRPRQSWLRTVEDVLHPLNFGLATRFGQIGMAATCGDSYVYLTRVSEKHGGDCETIMKIELRSQSHRTKIQLIFTTGNNCLLITE